MLAIFASVMMMSSTSASSSEGTLEGAPTAVAQEVSAEEPAIQAVASTSPASASSVAPATSARTQAWRKGKLETPWSLLEATMVSQGHGHLQTAKGEEIGDKARTEQLKKVWQWCVIKDGQF